MSESAKLHQTIGGEWVKCHTETYAVELLRKAVQVAREAHRAWDADQESRVGKLVMALSGYVKGYRAVTDEIHAFLKSLDSERG